MVWVSISFINSLRRLRLHREFILILSLESLILAHIVLTRHDFLAGEWVHNVVIHLTMCWGFAVGRSVEVLEDEVVTLSSAFLRQRYSRHVRLVHSDITIAELRQILASKGGVSGGLLIRPDVLLERLALVIMGITSIRLDTNWCHACWSHVRRYRLGFVWVIWVLILRIQIWRVDLHELIWLSLRPRHMVIVSSVDVLLASRLGESSASKPCLWVFFWHVVV